MKIMASSPITEWKIDGETMETVTDFVFLGSKITADGDCSHEIKRHLLFGRKVMTNLLPFELLRFQSHPCSAQPLLLTEPGALFTALCGLCDRAFQKPQPPPPLPRGSLSDAFALVLCFVFIMVLKGPLQCSCLENPRDRSLVGCRPWGPTESDTTEAAATATRCA